MKRVLISILILLVVAGCVSSPPAPPTTDRCLGLHTIGLPECSPPANLPETPSSQSKSLASAPSGTSVPVRSIKILIDDFRPQPYQGDDVYFYNRVGGDRGALNNSHVDWGNGQVTTTISSGNTWGGLWMSLNHPIREGLVVNFSAILPPQILPQYQSQITGIRISIAGGTPSALFRAELKDNNNHLQWANDITLNGTSQQLSTDLPALQDISQLVLVLDQATAGDYVIVDDISLVASTSVTDTATAAFVWSYGMLLNNWNSSTGLVRDKAKDASGEFDAVQATGSLAAATALAEQVGIINHADAVAIVDKISSSLLTQLPRNHGLWPHWVRQASDGKFEIVPGTEWSSVDTVIAAIGLLVAQQSLRLETSVTEQMLREIEWENLVTEKGISHGYTYENEFIPFAWDVFGGESWLVELAYAASTGKVAPLAYPSAPSANGSGFIDELAWLYLQPPSKTDYWETDWSEYRNDALEEQIQYFGTGGSDSCFGLLGFFGLSAAEVPSPAKVPKENIYQAFGIGGQFSIPNDGEALLGSPVVAPHYSGMIASLQPEKAIKMWDWFIEEGFLSPINNVESLNFPDNTNCNSDSLEWNQLKGSWNLALQALGWGRYLVERQGEVPATWQATETNPFLLRGYLILAPNERTTEVSISKQEKSLSEILERSNITCTNESIHVRILPGIYRYQYTDTNGDIVYYSTNPVAGNQADRSFSVFVWPPEDSSIPPSNSSTTEIEMESISTKFGKFEALRVETVREYRVLTTNHSDPSGVVTLSEWYVCGIGLVYGVMNHKGSYPYQLQFFERQSKLELISYTTLP